MDDLLYIEITFYKKDKGRLKKWLKKTFSEEDYYHSDKISHINGNVIDELHLTLFFGLDVEQPEIKKLKLLIKNIKKELKVLEISNLVLKHGYKNGYKILLLEISDKNGRLSNYFDSFKEFKYDPENIHDELYPHITLCYLKSNILSSNIIEQPLPSLKIKDIKISRFSN